MSYKHSSNKMENAPLILPCVSSYNQCLLCIESGNRCKIKQSFLKWRSFRWKTVLLILLSWTYIFSQWLGNGYFPCYCLLCNFMFFVLSQNAHSSIEGEFRSSISIMYILLCGSCRGIKVKTFWRDRESVYYL